MPRNKVRIIVKSDGNSRQIFSIEEAPKGDIYIIRWPDDRVYRDEQYSSKIREDRVSVHPSEGSLAGGITINRTRKHEDGGCETLTSFVVSDRDKVLIPVVSCLMPSMEDKKYDYKTRESEKRTIIGEYCSDKSSLIYHIFVVGKGRQPPEPHASSLYLYKGSMFNIAVVVTYANFFTSSVSMSAWFPTRAAKRDGVIDNQENEKFKSYYNKGAMSLENNEIESFILTLDEYLFSGSVERIISKYELEEPLTSSLRSHTSLFTKYPIDDSQPLLLKSDVKRGWMPKSNN